MNKAVLLSIIILVVSLNKIIGQTTTVSQNRNSKTETYTETVTQHPNGTTTTTITHTTTADMRAVFGIKVKANMSNFLVRNAKNCQNKMGFGVSAGVFLKLESKNFAIQYELLLRHKTSKMKNEEGKFRTNYKYWGLELPIYLMGQVNAGTGKFFMGAGPYISIGLDAVQKPENNDLYKKDSTNGKAARRRFDFGLGAISGYEFKNGININGGYQVGLINNLKAEKDSMTMKNQTVNLGVGYKF